MATIPKTKIAIFTNDKIIEKIVNSPTVASESSVAAAAPTAIINITRGANSKTIPEIRPKIAFTRASAFVFIRISLKKFLQLSFYHIFMKNKRNFKTSILDDECFPISLQTFRVKNRSCIRLFVNSFVFSSKLVIFIEKRRSLGSSFFVSVFARDLSFKDRLSEVVCGT